jgi:hypothetical protein
LWSSLMPLPPSTLLRRFQFLTQTSTIYYEFLSFLKNSCGSYIIRNICHIILHHSFYELKWGIIRFDILLNWLNSVFYEHFHNPYRYSSSLTQAPRFVGRCCLAGANHP